MNPLDDRRKRRITALSILRACKRAEETERPQVAKRFGQRFIVHPFDVTNLRDEYTLWLGSPRYRKSQSKQAVYQRAYRLRQKAKQSPSEDPLFDECCRVAGVQPWSPEGVIVDIVVRHLRARQSAPTKAYEAVTERVCFDPELNITRMQEKNLKCTLKQEPKKRGPYKKRTFTGNIKIGNARRPVFVPEAPSGWVPWQDRDEDDQPPQKQTPENLAPKSTTLIQHVFEYTP